MIDHISVACSKLGAATIFYDSILASIGYVRVWSEEQSAGYGLLGGEELFAVKQREKVSPPVSGFHIAFKAPTRASVDHFHKEALKLGARDEGGPALRPEHGPGYYAAFVSDLDGHLLEAVCHVHN